MENVIPNTPPLNGNWTITGSETYSDTTISVDGNISISGSLYLNNVTLSINSSLVGPNSIVVENGGSIYIRNGSVIIGSSIGSFFFKTLKGSYLELNRSKVEGCGVPEGEIDEKGLYSETSDFYAYNSSISNSPVGLTGEGSNITLSDVEIFECQMDGIHLLEGSTLEAVRTNISSCMSKGLDIRNSIAKLSSIRFYNCAKVVTMRESDVMVSDSIIFSNDPESIRVHSSILEMVDCVPYQMGMNGIFVAASSIPSNIYLLNTTPSDVVVEGLSKVYEAYRFDVRVTTNGGIPAHFADFEIKGPDGKVEKQALTGPDGWVLDLPIISRIHDLSGSRFNEPHNITVLYEGALRMKDVNTSLSHFTSLEVLLSTPIIQFTHPANFSWISTRSFTVTGKVTDKRPISSLSMFLDGGTEVKLTPGNSFSIPLSFGSDGEHDLMVKSMNADGRMSTAYIHFGIDTVDPMLSLDSPQDETYTSYPNITFSGSCEVGAHLYINEDLVNHTKGAFSYEVHLFEGWNDILVRSIDKAGNFVDILRRVYLDTTPPTLRILSPVNATTIKSDYIEIEGVVSHDTQMVLVNGIEIEFDIMGFTYRLEDLFEGENRIVVEAFDRTGSRTRSVIFIFVDSSPPWIEVVRPPSYTNQSRISITGTVERDSIVVVGGNLAVVTDINFQADVDLYLGRNNISITATDQIGNSRTIYIDTILDKESPTFERIEPMDRSNIKTMVAQVTGMVFDDHGIKGVWGRNTSSPRELISSNGTIEWIVMLESGENVFTIDAEDLAGNSRSIKLHYFFDNDQSKDRVDPQIAISTPLANETLPEGMITISGTASDDRSNVSVDVRIDGGNWASVDVNGSIWAIDVDLSKGVHLIEARAVDASGNTMSDLIRITVVVRGNENASKDKNDLGAIFFSILVIIVILALTVLIYLVVRNNILKKEWNETLQEEQGPQGDRYGRPSNQRRRPGPRPQVDNRRSSDRRNRLPRDLPDINENGSEKVGQRSRRRNDMDPPIGNK